MHLKCSKGSKHSLHLWKDLQAVDPNSLTNDVEVDLHWGQIILFDGGEIPYFKSFFLVESDIQSVVQAGE